VSGSGDHDNAPGVQTGGHLSVPCCDEAVSLMPTVQACLMYNRVVDDPEFWINHADIGERYQRVPVVASAPTAEKTR
jgi:hypothetical protein